MAKLLFDTFWMVAMIVKNFLRSAEQFSMPGNAMIMARVSKCLNLLVLYFIYQFNSYSAYDQPVLFVWN
jgi:hypothetical protein